MKAHVKQIGATGGGRRTLYAILGSACIGLGAIGVVVPGMPTTVFLLAASWLYARSCPGLHHWVLEHRVFGRYLRMAEGRSMPLRAKVVSLAMMWTGICAGCAMLGGTPARVVVAGLGLVGTAVLLLWVKTDREAAALSRG